MTQPILAAQTVRDHLVWREGGTDLWPLLNDPAVTARVVEGMAQLHDVACDVVLGPDPGGLLLGPLVARELRLPFAPVCRDRDFFFQGPHPRVTVLTPNGPLYAHRAALPAGSRVLLVDDWSESGATAVGVGELVAAAQARLAAVAFLVDSLATEVHAHFTGNGIPVRGLVAASELERPSW